MIGLKFKLIAALLIAAGVAGFFWHYTNLLKSVGKMETVIEKEQENHELTKQALAEFMAATESNFIRQQQIVEERTQRFREHEEALYELQTIFSKHDLERLMAAKPGLLERRFNAGTKRVLDTLTAVSAFDRKLITGEDETPPSSEGDKTAD